MRAKLKGKQHVIPKGKAPFTMLYLTYPRHGVDGEFAEGIYVADGFPLPTLTLGMTLDVDRDGNGFLIAVTEVKG
jgi:hypothetical protein